MKELKKRLESLLESPQGELNDKLQKVCFLLDQELEHFNWTGFYFTSKEKEELILGPYVGAPTDHTVIPFGKGICGQVAVSGETFLVEDVHKESNYLSCSIDTRSELVVPIIKEGKNLGQIDIDSHQVNAFGKEDQELLEWLCDRIAKLM